MRFTGIKRFYLLLSMTFVGMIFISCSSDSNDSHMPTGPGNNNTGGNVMTNMISMSGSTFSPSTNTVKVGTTVTWTNKDNVRHTVTSSNGAFTSSGDLFFDDAYSFTFTSAGSYPYFCSVHTHMTGTVTVIP